MSCQTLGEYYNDTDFFIFLFIGMHKIVLKLSVCQVSNESMLYSFMGWKALTRSVKVKSFQSSGTPSCYQIKNRLSAKNQSVIYFDEKHLSQQGFVYWLCMLRIIFNIYVWRRKWKPTPVLLFGESHGRRILVGYSPWGHKESDMTERLHFHFH